MRRARLNIHRKRSSKIRTYLIKFCGWGCVTVLIAALISFRVSTDLTDINLKPLLLTSIIVFFIYAFFNIALSPISSAITVLFFTALLRLASFKKRAATGEPLIFGDISHTTHISIALKYVQLHEFILVLIAIVLLIGINWVKSRNLILRKWWRYAILCGLVVVTLTQAHHLVMTTAANANKMGIPYYSWDWPHNYKTNGLIVHLAQTGNRPQPVSITEQERIEFNRLYTNAVPANDSPSLFINILCESCWYKEGLLDDEFIPIKKLATTEFRAVSPVFGGGTPNATLELLSGLSTHNPAVAGIIYQEYRDFFADATSTLPSHLRANNFQTESLHNYLQKFWFRDEVEPKLGFTAFHGIEQIAPHDEPVYPRDKILYDHAISRIEGAAGKKLFLHLATMYTHGPYTDGNGSEPIANYRKKLRASINDMEEFITSIRSKYPEAVFFIYGDHKPSLPETQLSPSSGRHEIGDVPVLIIDPIADRANKLRSQTEGRPFFCFPAVVAEIYYRMDLPVKKYNETACSEYKGSHYMEAANSIPAWVYTAAMFDETASVPLYDLVSSSR